MSLRINTNIDALIAHRNLTSQTQALSDSMQKLSSGLKINKAQDDAAGLAISEKMRAQISGLQQAQKNAGDGISLVQTADGALDEVHSILQRVRELAVQYNNSVYSPSQKLAMTTEVAALSNELYRISQSAKFMNISLLTGQSLITFQVGANSNEIITVGNVSLMDPGTGMITSSLFVWGASADLQGIDDAISTVADARSGFGAVQNRLEHSLNQLTAYEGNLKASESQIRDVDMASEMTKMTQLQMVQNANLAMLAQANQSASGLLRLLTG